MSAPARQPGRPASGPTPPRGELVADVLELVERIPPGRVMTYGDIAQAIGHGGPRQVGSVMSWWGSTVPWWRVVGAHGAGPTGHEAEALEHYRREGTALRAGSSRIDLTAARWRPASEELATGPLGDEHLVAETFAAETLAGTAAPPLGGGGAHE